MSETKKITRIIKGILIYLAGFITAIILGVIIILSSGVASSINRQGLTIFQEEGNPINETQFKVIQVLESNLALAIGKGDSELSILFTGITVLLMGDEGKYFYDDEVIELSSRPTQVGTYQYESKNGRKTVPVISIKRL
jgi:hypothetical protein